jgi:hypothetical protein
MTGMPSELWVALVGVWLVGERVGEAPLLQEVPERTTNRPHATDR